MKLQTQIPLSPQKEQIDYNSKILLLGSCFVENIGEKLDYYKFQHAVNPFGIIFHPLAIASLIQRIVEQRLYTENDVFYRNERWHCFEVHSLMSSPSKEQLLRDLNGRLRSTCQWVKTSSCLVLTFGTAWGYVRDYKVVANCHKVPQKEFDKILYTSDVIAKAIQSSIEQIRGMNPEVKIILTVSPVRHLKDGFIENQQSKANLITAVHQVVSSEANTYYFPSYEIMMDELRDYRFYAEDMVHPNTLAVNYIWEKFKQVWIVPSVFDVMEKVCQIQKGLAHKPFNPESEEHQIFKKKLQHRIDKLQEQYPDMVF